LGRDAIPAVVEREEGVEVEGSVVEDRDADSGRAGIVVEGEGAAGEEVGHATWVMYHV